MAEGTGFHGQIGAAEGVSSKRLFGSELCIVMALAGIMTGNQRLRRAVRNALFDLGRPRTQGKRIFPSHAIPLGRTCNRLYVFL